MRAAGVRVGTQAGGPPAGVLGGTGVLPDAGRTTTWQVSDGTWQHARAVQYYAAIVLCWMYSMSSTVLQYAAIVLCWMCDSQQMVGHMIVQFEGTTQYLEPYIVTDLTYHTVGCYLTCTVSTALQRRLLLFLL